MPVADCDQKHYDSQEKKTFTLQEYIHYWNGLRKSSEGKQLCLYLKVKFAPWKYNKLFQILLILCSTISCGNRDVCNVVLSWFKSLSQAESTVFLTLLFCKRCDILMVLLI